MKYNKGDTLKNGAHCGKPSGKYTKCYSCGFKK